MQLSRESKILAGICLLDMVSTVWLVTSGLAGEANPVMRFYLDVGLFWFIFAKSLLVIAPVFVLELLRVRSPHFVRGLMRVGILLYLLCYGLSVWQVNMSEGVAQASSAPAQTSTP